METGIESPAPDYRFGDWLVQSTQNRLSRANQSVQLDAKSMDVLVYLIESDGRVVSSEELLEAIWPGRVVEQSTIHRRINQLRRALGDDPRRPDYLETIVKRGYRTVASVERLAPDASPPASNTRDADTKSTPTSHSRNLLMGALATAMLAGVLGWLAFNRDASEPASAPPSITIAVFPFDDLGPDPDQLWIADGLSEALAIYLARVDWVVVKPISRGLNDHSDLNSSFAHLGADVIVRGSVQRMKDQLVVNAQLLRASNQQQLWSARYDFASNELFEVQRGVARSVVDAIETPLGLTPTLGKSAIDEARFGTSDLRAYRLYRKAFDLKFSKPAPLLTDQEVRLTLEYNEQAIAIDPNFSQGWVGVGHSYMLRFLRTLDPRDVWAAGDAYEHAVALDPSNPVAVGNLVSAYAGGWRWQDAVHLVEQAPSWRPIAEVGLAMESYFRALINLGRWQEARSAFDRMTGEVRLAPHRFPRGHIVHAQLAAIATAMFRDDVLAASLASGTSVNPDGTSGDARLALARALRTVGRHEDVVQLLAGVSEPDRVAAERAYQRSGWNGLLKGFIERQRHRNLPCFRVISAYAELGEATEMYRCLDHVLGFKECDAAPEGHELECATSHELAPLPIWTAASFDAYRDQPRFRALLDHAGVVGHEACCDGAVAPSSH